MTYSIIDKSFCTEFCSWPEKIELCVTDELRDRIEAKRSILKYNPDVQKLYIDVPQEVISEQSFIDMQDACPFETHSIIVEDVTVRYFVESEWSRTIRAEYDFTDLIPHPVVETMDNEFQAFKDDIDERKGEQDPDALYEVQTFNASDGWMNTWSVLDENNKSVPQTFTSRKAAQIEIDEHVADALEAIEDGDFDAVVESYKIVPISKV